MKGIVLCSGGLDSTLALIRLLKEGNLCVPMFVDYNQWSLEGERNAVREASSYLVEKEGKLSLPISLTIRNGETQERVGSAWGRGIALVGLAAMYAYTHGDDYGFIALGNHRGDVGPDCKPGVFDARMDAVLETATKGRMRLSLPIRNLTVEDIGRELGEYGIPWEYMYSCYWYPSCQYRSENDTYLCPGCRRKVIAMRAAKAPADRIYPPNGSRSYQSPLAEPTEY